MKKGKTNVSCVCHQPLYSLQELSYLLAAPAILSVSTTSALMPHSDWRNDKEGTWRPGPRPRLLTEEGATVQHSNNLKAKNFLVDEIQVSNLLYFRFVFPVNLLVATQFESVNEIITGPVSTTPSPGQPCLYTTTPELVVLNPRNSQKNGHTVPVVDWGCRKGWKWRAVGYSA